MSSQPHGNTGVSERHPCRVLAVEDDPDVAESFRLLLELTGSEVRSVPNGPTAIDTARQFRPNIAFIDIDLPGMDGYELARRLRREHGNDLRLFALTGFGQQRDKERAKEAGFDLHLVKPLDVEVLDRLLRALSA